MLFAEYGDSGLHDPMLDLPAHESSCRRTDSATVNSPDSRTVIAPVFAHNRDSSQRAILQANRDTGGRQEKWCALPPTGGARQATLLHTPPHTVGR